MTSSLEDIHSDVVIITKCQSRWHAPLLRFLKYTHGSVQLIYINDEIQKKTLPAAGQQLVDQIVLRISEIEPALLIFDLEFSLLLSPLEVSKICRLVSCPTFGIAMDDDRFHDINRELYAGVDGILTHPLSVERYRLINFVAYSFFPSFELCRTNHDEYQPCIKKDIDVLSYGLLKGDRKEVLEELKSLDIDVMHPPFETSDDELNELIRRSKIVINLSSGSPISSNPLQFLPFTDLREELYPTRQLKSRIYEVAALGTLCVSEEFAGDQLILSDGLLTVESPKKMVTVIQNLLSDPDFYISSENRFLNSFRTKYNLTKRIDEFREFVNLRSENKHTRSTTNITFEAACVATKSLYSRSLLPIFTIFGSRHLTILQKLSITFFSVRFLTQCLWGAILSKIRS